jgi:hypothetical protein
MNFSASKIVLFVMYTNRGSWKQQGEPEIKETKRKNTPRKGIKNLTFF